MKARALALALAISVPLATAYSGDLTFYTPSFVAANSACAIAAQPGEPIVAISHLKFTAPNPNNDPLCGSTITIYNPYNGQSIPGVKVVDKCMGCAETDIDVNVELFEALGFQQGQGRIHGVDWGGDAAGGKKRDVKHPHGKV